MVRKQLNISDEQDLLLKHEAERMGVSESEVVRRALDALAARLSAEHGEGWRSLEEVWAAQEERRRTEGPGKPYTFRREDAYEDRLKRYDK